jgi:hypothetical protein
MLNSFRAPPGLSGKMKSLVCSAAIGLLLILSVPGRAATFTPQEASGHVGEMATICGTVVSTNFAKQVAGRPTFLDMGKPYPDEAFTILIWGNDRARFGTPESSFLRKQLCATGQIQSYDGRPQIIVRDPAQLVPQE